jgi:hypothetical protein
MKKSFMGLWLLLLATVLFSQTEQASLKKLAASSSKQHKYGTTNEEYNYLTKGHKIQIESGLDMKKGYTLKDIPDNITCKSPRCVEIKALYRDTINTPIAHLIIYSNLQTKESAQLCLPNIHASPSMWNLFFDSLSILGTEATRVTLLAIGYKASRHRYSG